MPVIEFNKKPEKTPKRQDATFCGVKTVVKKEQAKYKRLSIFITKISSAPFANLSDRIFDRNSVRGFIFIESNEGTLYFSEFDLKDMFFAFRETGLLLDTYRKNDENANIDFDSMSDEELMDELFGKHVDLSSLFVDQLQAQLLTTYTISESELANSIREKVYELEEDDRFYEIRDDQTKSSLEFMQEIMMLLARPDLEPIFTNEMSSFIVSQSGGKFRRPCVRFEDIFHSWYDVSQKYTTISLINEETGDVKTYSLRRDNT